MSYVKEINKRFNFWNIVFDSLLLSVIIYLLDYYDLPTFIYSRYKVLMICLLILFIYFVIKEMFNKKLWNLVNIETISYFDKTLFIGLFSEIILVFSYFDNICYLYILLTILLINCCLLLIRENIINNLIIESTKKETNVYSIFELFNKKIQNEELVLLEEKALIDKEHDLLDMGLFVDNIKTTLLQCRPKENFVMSLVGKWGSGKTTVINLLKQSTKNNKDVVIDVFNPWKYDNKLSLFKGFYNYMFETFGKNYGYFNYKELFKKYENLIFNLVEKQTNISLHNIFNTKEEKDIEEIKNSINDYINYNPKKLVVVIDDIDRLDKEQILLIFKTIKTLFDFNNVVYVLCYDEERINNMFENELKIDCEYLNKIIQNKISIPMIENSKISEVGIQCVLNLLDIYDIKNYNRERLKTSLNLIFNDFIDLREVIRFINTISITIKCCYKLQLDICDYISLEYIKFKDLGLYNEIYKNSTKFVSEDREKHFVYDSQNEDKFNEEAINFFKELFTGKKQFEKILSNVFPYVDNYAKGYEIRNGVLFVSEDRKKTIISKRCCNGRYFKCYFIIRHSFFTELSNLLDEFIYNVNKGNLLEKELNYIIGIVDKNNHNLLFELIGIRVNEINNKDKLFNYILKNITKYENNSIFWGLNSNERAKILLASIINNEEEQKKKQQYLNKISKKDLLLLDSILYWLGTEKYGHSIEDETYLYGKQLLCNNLKEIMEKNINIFDKQKYERFYCRLFNKYLENELESKQYLTGLINKDNIFRIIAEGISTWIGVGISYEYNEGILGKIVELSKIDEVLNNIDYTLNSDQEKVLDLYNNKGKKEISVQINFNNL